MTRRFALFAVAAAVLSLACVEAVTVARLQASFALQANSGSEAQGAPGSFVPPPMRMCVMYNYALKHDDDGAPNREFVGSDSLGQLADGTTYGRDIQGKHAGYAPCVLVNLEGDLLNLRGEIVAKFKLTKDYPTPPCLGAIKTGLLGGTKNSAGNKCTPLVGRDNIWRSDASAKWYADPKQIPPQFAAQQSLTQLAPSALPRTRLCILYNYDLKHDSDSGFPEYMGQGDIFMHPDGTTYARDNRQNKAERWSACTLTNLEGDRVDQTGRIIQKFTLGGDYPTVPCLGSFKNALLGGVKNVLGHSCTRPVGADAIWVDWEASKWYPKAEDVPDKSGKSPKQAAADAAAAANAKEAARRAALAQQAAAAAAAAPKPAARSTNGVNTRQPYVDENAIYQREVTLKAVETAKKAEQALRDSGSWGVEQYNKMYQRGPTTNEGKALAAANIAAYGRAEGRGY